MATTGTVALREIRRQLNDLEADDGGLYRWPTDDLVRYMNDIIRQMEQTHPEFFAGSSLPTSPVSDLTTATLSGNLPFTDAGLNFFNDAVVAKAFMEDSEAPANMQRAQAHIQLANAEA